MTQVPLFVKLYVIGFEPPSFDTIGMPERERILANSDGVFVSSCLVPLKHTWLTVEHGRLEVVGHEHDGKILVCQPVTVPQ